MSKQEKEILARLKEIHNGMNSCGFFTNNADDIFDLLTEEEEGLCDKLRKIRERAALKKEVTEEWILEWERRLAHYALGLTAKEANREVRTMLKEIGVEIRGK